MNDDTITQYAKKAVFFYEKYLPNSKDRTPKKITDALAEYAKVSQPSTVRQMKCALIADQEANGYRKAAKRLREWENTHENRSELREKRKKRINSVSEDDYQKLLDGCANKPDLRAAIQLIKITGCRPVELRSIKVLDGNRIFIEGAKKSEDRGIDRTIVVSDHQHSIVSEALKELMKHDFSPSSSNAANDKRVNALNSKMHRLSKKVFPNWKKRPRPSLYSFRHNYATALKNSGISRLEMAYCMGHATTKSIEIYGNKRSKSSTNAVKPAISKEEIGNLVRENHTEPPSSGGSPSITQAPVTPDLASVQPLPPESFSR